MIQRFIREHPETHGHEYELRRKPSTNEAYCATCVYAHNTTAWAARYANDPEFRARHNRSALKSFHKAKS